MRTTIGAILFIGITLSSSPILAQFDKTRGYARVAGGITYFKPMTTGKTEMPEAWHGVNFRIQRIEFGINAGKVRLTEKPDSMIPVYTSYLGYHIPLFPKMSIGQRPFGIKGFLIQPCLTPIYGVTSSYKSEGSFFIGAAPGISIQLPYFLIEARYNNQLNLLSKDGLIKGLVHGPQINLQMDGLFDVFNPRIIKGGIQSITTMTYTPTMGNYHYETYGKGTVTGYAKVITPFIGITPGYTFAPSYNHKPGGDLFGIGASGRISFFSLDLFTRSGKMGFGTKAPTENGKPRRYKTKNWDASIDKFSGTQKISSTEYRFGFDLARVLMTAFYPVALGTKKILYHPRYFRFYIGWGAGSYKIKDDPQFKHSENTGVLYSNPQSVINGDANSSWYNPTKFTNGKIRSSFMALELGSIGFSWDYKVYKNAGLMSGQTFSVYSTIPLGRVWKAYHGKLPKNEVDEK